MKFEKEFTVGIREVGMKNELTNYGFLSFLEDIATLHSDTVGYGVKDVSTKKGAWILLEWDLEVKKRVPFGEKLNVITYAVTPDKLSFHTYRNFEIYHRNELIATATSKWVFYNFELNKITKLNSDIIQLFNPEGNAAESEAKLTKLKEPDSYTNIYEYEVKRADIDVNKHVNNLNYLRLAYEMLPEDVYFGEELNHLRIMYKRQIKLGDKIKCYYSYENNKHIVTIKSEDEKTLHAIIELW